MQTRIKAQGKTEATRWKKLSPVNNLMEHTDTIFLQLQDFHLWKIGF